MSCPSSDSIRCSQITIVGTAAHCVRGSHAYIHALLCCILCSLKRDRVHIFNLSSYCKRSVNKNQLAKGQADNGDIIVCLPKGKLTWDYNCSLQSISLIVSQTLALAQDARKCSPSCNACHHAKHRECHASLQDMVCHRSVGTVLSAFFDGTCHIGYTNTAIIIGIPVCQFDFFPFPASAAQLYGSAKAIRIWNEQGSCTAMNFDIRQRCTRHGTSKLVISVPTAPLSKSRTPANVLAFQL